ncbi:MAG: hypothetical protein LQ345_000335 [Seirophora villosa]|nr:MAG: hypothetical protein LQ345_000335 [Seirophora villosa]
MASADVEIPKQYKAAVYDAPGKISTKIETLDTPEPGPGEVLIKLDLGIMENSVATPPPLRAYPLFSLLTSIHAYDSSGVHSLLPSSLARSAGTKALASSPKWVRPPNGPL